MSERIHRNREFFKVMYDIIDPEVDCGFYGLCPLQSAYLQYQYIIVMTINDKYNNNINTSQGSVDLYSY